MRRWVVIAIAFATGLAATIAGLHLTAAPMTCQAARTGRTCTANVVGQELVYAGLALLAVALLTAVATLATIEAPDSQN